MKNVLLIFILIPLLLSKAMASEFEKTIPNNFQLPSAESDYDKNLFKQLEDIGWHNVHINAEGELPSFSFTIGHFYKFNHPEILVVGLKSEISQQLLNIVAIKIAGAKERIEPYKKYPNMAEGLNLAFIPVSLKHYKEYLGYASWFYGSMKKPYPALQMIWPDKEGLFPWEKGYNKGFLKFQPILGKLP